MDTIKLHIYTDTKELQCQVASELKNDKSTRENADGQKTESGTIETERAILSVDIFAGENVRHIVSHEIELKCLESTMVFLSDTDTIGIEQKAHVLHKNFKKTILYGSLPLLWEALISELHLCTETNPTQGPKELLYRMTSSPRGICMIINNAHFQKETNGVIEERQGTTVDTKKLHNYFQKMDFVVQQFNDLADTDIVREVKQMSLKDHTQHDIFMCCILSHGAKGSVFGVNYKEVPIHEITSEFRVRGCPSLAGKPKVFIIQACQGSRAQIGIERNPEGDVCSEEDETRHFLPDGGDFLVTCATEPGYQAFRDTQNGSYYINSLIEHLKSSPDRSFIDILTDVCNTIGKKTFKENCKQVPSLMSTLTRKLVIPSSQTRQRYGIEEMQ